MKRKKATIVLCIFAIFIGLLIYFLFSNHDAPIRYDKNIILSNKDAYTIVANICYEDYEKNKEDNEFLTYSPWPRKDADAIDKKAYCLSTDNYFNINNEQTKAFDIVVNTYKLDDHNNGIDRIYVKDNFVIFGNEGGQTAFIYSVNGEKPSGYEAGNTNDKAYVEKICDNWYYACRKNVILN